MPRSTIQDLNGQVARRVPLYRQRRNYTCGPSSLLMVMSALDERYEPSERAELEIWREATTIHGGCGPAGLALALKRRGFAAHIVVSHDGLFLESRASRAEEVDAMRILQERDLEEANNRGIRVHVAAYGLADLASWIADGWYPVVMISIEYEGRTITHWVVVTGVDIDHVFYNDPLKDDAEGDGATRIDHATFDKMKEFGPKCETAVVLAGLPEMENIGIVFHKSPEITASSRPAEHRATER